MNDQASMKKVLVAIGIIFSQLTAMAQFTLSGTVKDENNNLLPGATVKIRESNLGIATTANGQFTFNDIKEGEYVRSVSFVGYSIHTELVNIQGNVALAIVLKESVIYQVQLTLLLL